VTPRSLPVVDSQEAAFAAALAVGDVSPVRPL